MILPPQVCLLDVDGELADLVPAGDRRRARAALKAPVVAAPAGSSLDELALPDDVFSLLLVRGTMMQTVVVEDRQVAELALPGDVVLPWEPEVGGIPSRRDLTAIEDVALAALDRRFLRAAAHWPELMVAIQRRVNDQEHRVATIGAICQIPRVERRLLHVMRHLADRMGRVGLDGTIVRLPMTHEQLGRLVGARRSTVTLALGELGAAGALRRRPDGAWLLGAEA